MLLIVGGSKDHNLHRLAHAAEWRNYPFQFIWTDIEFSSSINWQPSNNYLTINDTQFLSSETSLFLRYDVFNILDKTETNEQTRRNRAWFDAIKGWAEAYPEVGILNRCHKLDVSKPRGLVWAKEAGFLIPETWITNCFDQFHDPDAYIVKPVSGGDYTRLLRDRQITDQPYLVQSKLNYPELRLFRVGSHYFAFLITSKLLDYRIDNHYLMEEVSPPDNLIQCMKRLTDRMGLDYAAADFKTCPQTENLLFLEINTMPMFTGYDNIAQGRLSDAIFLQLRDAMRNS